MAWDDTPDTELLKRIENNDRDAFRSFSNRYAPIVFRCLRPYVGDHTRAVWMTETIVARFLVRSQMIPNADVEMLLRMAFETVREGCSETPGAGLSEKQLALLKQLASLSVIDRIIIEMVHFEGAPADVVCRRLGLPPDRIAIPLAKLSGKTAPVATVSKRRPENESRPHRPYGNIPGKRPGSETRRYYHDSDRNRRGKR